MLQRLKTLDVDRLIDMEELVELSTLARSLKAEFVEHELDVPEWLSDKAKTLNREINARNQDAIERRLRELKNRRETLETPAERKKKINAEIQQLEAKLVS